jgi:hypothetical protein
MNKENGYVLLGPEVVKEMLAALDTLAIAAAGHPTFGHHAEWDDLGGICLAMRNDAYPMPQVTHLSDYQGKHYFESGRVTDRYPVLDDNVEVVTTIYPWGHELVNPPMPNTSWDNIVNYINANVKCGVIVNVEFTPKKK